MPLTARLNGTDFTEICQKITWRPRLNLTCSALVRYPAQLMTVAEGIDELQIYSGNDLKFSGPVWYPQGEGEPNSAYMEVTAYDHRIYLPRRLCKEPSDSPAGNLITPGDVLLDNVTAPAILAAYIANTASIDGPLPLAVGTVEGGGADVSGVPTDFPMALDRMLNMLVATGQLDIRATPGIGFTTLDLLNDYDNDISSTVRFEYGTGLHNSQIATLTLDMDVMINALWYLLGPRLTEERWRGSITPSAPHPGGSWPSALLARIMNSRALYGYMQEIKIFDDKGDENSIRPLFEEEWANEAWIRAVPRTFASVRPERGIAPEFDVGDRIGIAIGSVINGGLDADQTVYGFDWTTDADGVDEIEEILTSADASGATGAG